MPTQARIRTYMCVHVHVHARVRTHIHYSVRNHAISVISPTAYLLGITEWATHEDQRAASVEGAYPWSQLRGPGHQGQPHLLLHFKSEIRLRCTRRAQSKTTQRTDSEAGFKHHLIIRYPVSAFSWEGLVTNENFGQVFCLILKVIYILLKGPEQL